MFSLPFVVVIRSLPVLSIFRFLSFQNHFAIFDQVARSSCERECCIVTGCQRLARTTRSIFVRNCVGYVNFSIARVHFFSLFPSFLLPSFHIFDIFNSSLTSLPPHSYTQSVSSPSLLSLSLFPTSTVHFSAFFLSSLPSPVSSLSPSLVELTLCNSCVQTMANPADDPKSHTQEHAVNAPPNNTVVQDDPMKVSQ